MEINSEQLQALLDLLVQSGVEEFEGFGFHVRFTPNLFTKDKEVHREDIDLGPLEIMREEPTSVWGTEALWPGGKPPTFPSNK